MRVVIPWLVAVFVTAAMFWQAEIPDAVLMPAPEVVLPDLEGAVAEDGQMSEAELRTLPPDTVLKRRIYRFDNGHILQLSVVVGGRSKSSVHRPELCLPGQGFLMTDPRNRDVRGVSWRLLTLEQANGGRACFAYTFVNGTGFRTSSHLVRILTDVWDRSILGRIDRWVMITVSSSMTDERLLSKYLEHFEGVVK